MSLTLGQETETPEPPAPKRAAIYLRVSSAGQVNTDYDPEGLSIPAQRQACTRFAERHGATVAREYVEPGVSGGSLLKRAAFRRMIEEIGIERDIDLVIVWSVSRWARNQEDHWVARGLVTKAGAKLLSVKEPIGEDTSHGILLEGVMAAAAAARRIEISEEVKRGIKRKIEVGGTSGLAPIGYLNVREPLPQGGEVRTVIVDPDRAPIIKWAYETYATGLYGLSDITTLLEARGLRSRATARRAPRPLNLSHVHKMLKNTYYIGYVTHKGRRYQGRHDPIIPQDLFDEVQAVLVAHRHSGERSRKHEHFLKGTIRCTCGAQLVYSRNSGTGGTYEYFFCTTKQRGGDCGQGYIPVDLVEAEIERHYATVSLTTAERERVREAITTDLGERIALAQQEVDRCQRVLRELKERERKLLRMHYDERISDELFDDEQATIRRDRHDTEALMARLDLNHEDILATLQAALEILGDDLQALYQTVSDNIRRLLNQALFKALYIHDEEIERSELASPFAEIWTLKNSFEAGHTTEIAELYRRRRQPTDDNQPDHNDDDPSLADPLDAELWALKDSFETGHTTQIARSAQRSHATHGKGPAPYRGQGPSRVSSNTRSLVRSSGLEPPRREAHKGVSLVQAPKEARRSERIIH